jgi:hypothetical protein
MGFYIPEDAILHSHRRENLKAILTALCFVRAIHAVDSHVAPVVRGDAVGLVPHVLAAGLLPRLAVGRC